MGRSVHSGRRFLRGCPHSRNGMGYQPGFCCPCWLLYQPLHRRKLPGVVPTPLWHRSEWKGPLDAYVPPYKWGPRFVRPLRNTLSSETATRITDPVAKAVQLMGTLKYARPLLTTPSKMEPSAAPTIVAFPPRSEVPPF